MTAIRSATLRATLLATLLALLLAGCATPPADDASHDPSETSPEQWEPLPCDPSGATTIGNNAPPVTGLRGTDEDVAARVAQAFGDEVTSATPVDSTAGFARWSTTTGYVQVSHDDGTTRWDVTTWRGDLPSEATLREGLVELGAAEDSLRPHHAPGMIQQAWQGQILVDSSASFLKGQGDPAPMGRYGSFSLTGFVEAPGPLDTLPEEDLMATARDFDRCALDAEGRTEAAGYVRTSIHSSGYAVVNDSLVLQVVIQYTEPEESHCGFNRGVAVDAVTGAVHGPSIVYCG